MIYKEKALFELYKGIKPKYSLRRSKDPARALPESASAASRALTENLS
jgi:hypothetical protein